MSAIIDFYVDPIRPYAWLAMRELEDRCKMKCALGVRQGATRGGLGAW